MSSAIDLVVHLSRLRDGTRRVTHVSEVQHMEGDVIIMQDLFMFDFSAGMDEHGRYKGTLKSLGIRPHFADKLEDAGMKLDSELFQAEEFARVRVARR